MRLWRLQYFLYFFIWHGTALVKSTGTSKIVGWITWTSFTWFKWGGGASRGTENHPQDAWQVPQGGTFSLFLWISSIFPLFLFFPDKNIHILMFPDFWGCLWVWLHRCWWHGRFLRKESFTFHFSPNALEITFAGKQIWFQLSIYRLTQGQPYDLPLRCFNSMALGETFLRFWQLVRTWFSLRLDWVGFSYNASNFDVGKESLCAGHPWHLLRHLLTHPARSRQSWEGEPTCDFELVFFFISYACSSTV